MIQGEGFVMLHGRDVHASNAHNWPTWMWRHLAYPFGWPSCGPGGWPVGGRNVR